MTLQRLSLVGAMLVLIGSHFALAAPDEDALGEANSYPRGDQLSMFADRFKVGSFSAAYKINRSREVERGPSATPLTAEKGPEIAYRLSVQRYTLDDFLDRQRVTALLLLKGDRILAEHYQYDRKDDDRFISFSMAKSVNSLLISIALEKGLIASLDDRAEKYVSELAGSGYGQATIRQLLRMSAGIEFSEVYAGKGRHRQVAGGAAG
jgi:CubicO group peptidase (beta-lactamase class C family)